jgi:hypothetical protein
MACNVQTIRTVRPYVTLKRCSIHGIAWVEDGTSGTASSAHPNMSNRHASLKPSRMRARNVYGRDARVVACHGWAYNTSDVIVRSADDKVAADACKCGGNHGTEASTDPR